MFMVSMLCHLFYVGVIITSCLFVLSSLETGYLTGYSGDTPRFGPWQYRLMGFKDPPTDFYTRPFFMIAGSVLKTPDLCLDSRTISKVQFDYIRQVFDMFKNQLKFFFSFNGEIIFLYSQSK